MFIALPNAVLHAIQLLNSAGYEAYAVGGCVRDSMLGKVPTDWDITTSADPHEMQTVFSEYRCIKTGLRHGTLTVMVEDMSLEITTYRMDGDYSDGRHPDTVTFTQSLSEDLRRRDFTVNAMAYHPISGLVDLYNGQADLTNGVIRCVGEAKQRLSEDALRILRALRFASVLGFEIEADTAMHSEALSPTLSRVSVERITAEFKKLICGNDAVHVLNAYYDVISVFLPEIGECKDFQLLSCTKAIPRARLAALFYTASLSAQEAEAALRRLKMDNRTIRDVRLLLESLESSLYTEESYLLRLLNRLGPELVYDYLAIRKMDERTVKSVDRLLKEQVCYQISMLAVTGDDVVAAGVSPGPDVGRMLQILLDAVIDGLCPNCKADLLNYIQIIKKPVQ